MKTIGLLIIALSISTLLHGQQLLTKDQQQVQHTVINFFEALSNRDSVSLKNHCTDDILLIEYSQVWNLDTLIRKAIIQNITTDFKRINTIDFLTSSVDKSIASATYNLHSDIVIEGKQETKHWLETVVLVKERKRWKIKILHSSFINKKNRIG